ncbi:MAG TPA: hypothetical protein VJR89_02560 [Polyangiales bacterium]|nr:hypothetical protein [Polyangiales bacterium]
MSTLLLLLLQAFSFGPHQDVTLSATLLAPVNLGLALASASERASKRRCAAGVDRSLAQLGS